METKQVMIEFLSNNFEAILTFIAGGGIMSFAKFRSVKRQAEADAAIKWQEVYERLIDKLEKTNDKLQDDNNGLRTKLEELTKTVNKISIEVAGLRRYKCIKSGCKDRQTE